MSGYFVFKKQILWKGVQWLQKRSNAVNLGYVILHTVAIFHAFGFCYSCKVKSMEMSSSHRIAIITPEKFPGWQLPSFPVLSPDIQGDTWMSSIRILLASLLSFSLVIRLQWYQRGKVQLRPKSESSSFAYTHYVVSCVSPSQWCMRDRTGRSYVTDTFLWWRERHLPFCLSV